MPGELKVRQILEEPTSPAGSRIETLLPDAIAPLSSVDSAAGAAAAAAAAAAAVAVLHATSRKAGVPHVGCDCAS
jgi:hypothetical protein